ncbi:MAG: zinc-ribbon domain-containing protein [Clostridiales bacterium]|nr:zinc-ribbon domain-containing protein [Candidatus Equinaster intestinalis]
MALSVNGKTCPICHAYLFDEDDVVYCPICGAPHHRDCYNSVGHCGLEQFHGTENEYSSKKEIPPQIEEENDDTAEIPRICPKCMKEIEKDAQVCPYCGTPQGRVQRLGEFEIFGAVNKNDDIGEGVTAKEAADFVGLNISRYLYKFKNAAEGKKASFNWVAFLLPEGWFFLRKMYKQGALAVAVMVAANILSFPLAQMTNEIVVNNRNELVNYLTDKLLAGNYLPFVLAGISMLMTLALRIISGVFGDNFYRKHIISHAQKARLAEDREEYVIKHGGLSLLVFLAGILITTYLPNLIYGFLM